MKIIDNVLDKEYFLNFKKEIMSPNFPWFLNSYRVFEDDKDKQFTHTFYRDYTIQSKYWNQLYPVLLKLKALAFVRIKANLNLKKNINYRSKMHKDYEIQSKNYKSAIFYINTNNGYTLFKDGKKVDCVENRLLIFNSHKEHCAVDCTDQDTRIVINIIYCD